MSRSTRQSKILSLIAIHDIDTQEDLVRLLANEGFVVTQATVSRDIKELGIVKVLADNGVKCQITTLGIDDKFVEQGTPAELYFECGYDAKGIFKALFEEKNDKK